MSIFRCLERKRCSQWYNPSVVDVACGHYEEPAYVNISLKNEKMGLEKIKYKCFYILFYYCLNCMRLQNIEFHLN